MLIISLIVSTLLLLTANRFARRERKAGPLIVCSSVAFLVGPVLLTCILPTVAIQAVLICGAVLLWRVGHRGPSSFLKLSCGATLIAYTLTGLMALKSEREYAGLRARYPYESMERRLPTPGVVPAGTPLPPATAERVSQLETQFPVYANAYRESQLRMLHENAVDLFINSPGFGVSRMLVPSVWGLDGNRRTEPVPRQPDLRFTSVWSPGEGEPLPAEDIGPLGRMLDESFLDFVYPEGFGYLKDRRHVAGFEAHRFRRVPEPANRWEVRALELVSLLVHDEPKVYVSTDLPRMDRLHAMPTRPLDRFERFGLDALRRGEDLVTSRSDEGVRMLGAVRSVKQCVACHGGGRGDLLGAFSYALRSDGP